MKSRQGAVPAIVFVLLAAVSSAGAREWTDATGTFSVEAELLEVKDGKAVLKKADGAIIAVPLERLSQRDRKFIAAGPNRAAPEAASKTESEATPRASAAADAADEKGGRPLRVAYFAPADREPEAGFQSRLDRVMTHIQAFYRNGMRRNGHGPMTFDLDRNESGQLNIIMVKGEGATLSYDNESKDKIRDDVRREFAKHGLDFDREVVIVFQALLLRQPGMTTKIGPFIGGGNGYKGSALVYDDVRLDAAYLGSKQPDPFSADGKSIGDFNTGYIGGAAHELGHAFGLGHDAERPSLRQRTGRSLMGRGNHDYGEELRGEGPGAHLTAASAAPLALHPLFTKRDLGDAKADFRITRMQAVAARGGMTLEGSVQGTMQAAGLVAFNDPDTDPSDYDAVGWTAPIKPDGSFRCLIGDLSPGGYELRIRVYGENGQAKRFAYPYRVDGAGRVDATQLQIVE